MAKCSSVAELLNELERVRAGLSIGHTHTLPSLSSMASIILDGRPDLRHQIKNEFVMP